MSENVVWIVEGKIKTGERDAFDAVMNEMVESSRKEEGTLNYQWTIAEDNASVHIYERYNNTDAVSVHLTNTWSNFSDRFLAAVDVTKFTVFSSLTPALREAVSGLNPTYMTSIGGFAK